MALLLGDKKNKPNQNERRKNEWLVAKKKQMRGENLAVLKQMKSASWVGMKEKNI